MGHTRKIDKGENMGKIKILHVTQASYGGVAEYIKLLLKNMDRNKYEPDVVCTSYGNLHGEIEKLGIHVKNVDMEREISLKRDFSALVELTRYVKETKPDIVYLHSSKAGVIGRLACLINGVSCLYNPHGWAFSMDVSKIKKSFYAFIERTCSHFTDIIINISDYEKRLALDYRVASPKKIKVIYNGIDEEKFTHIYSKEDVLNELGIPKNSYIIGMVGRITGQKSPETFIEVAKLICGKIPEAYFILVGDGELRKMIEDKILMEGLSEKIKITGWTSDVSRYISTFDIGLLTSKWEGFGLVLVEYMAMDKPVVASNVGGIPNVIQNGLNGILVEPGDSKGFAEAVMKIKGDSEIREMLVENGNKCVVEKFNIKRVIEEHEKIIKNFDITSKQR